ncbi:hypothetical protein BGX33_010362 [Mortierella sp. NVP41]|nr:hypothetical protein BGX33_010362 [Mortierella sp. NVP41]
MDIVAKFPARMIPEEIVRNVDAEVIRGLMHLRRQGIIHNDLKLENIFLFQKDGGAIIADFGQSARYTGEDEQMLPSRYQLGNIAPEQIRRCKGNIKADV